MSARAAAAVVLIAGAGIGVYLAMRRQATSDVPLDHPFYQFDWTSGADADAAAWASPDEYEPGALDQVGDVFLPVAYRVENLAFGLWGNRMMLSLAGLAHLKQWEGLKLNPYKDAAGLWTIGYGHLLKPGEWWDSITEAQASSLLAQDVGTAEDAVNSLVKVKLAQTQFDALVSFVYNVGVGAFRRSTLLKLLNAGDYAGAAAQLPAWRKAGGQVIQGLVNRRNAELALFNAGGTYA